MSDGATHRSLDRVGETVTLTNYTTSGSDDSGENWVETEDSPKEITARVVRERRPTRQPSQREVAYVETDTSIYVKDTVSGINDGGGQGASTIETDRHKYFVNDLNDQDNGLFELRCQRSK